VVTSVNPGRKRSVASYSIDFQILNSDTPGAVNASAIGNSLYTSLSGAVNTTLPFGIVLQVSAPVFVPASSAGATTAAASSVSSGVPSAALADGSASAGIGTGGIVGIAVGGAAALVIIVIIVVLVVRRSRSHVGSPSMGRKQRSDIEMTVTGQTQKPTSPNARNTNLESFRE